MYVHLTTLSVAYVTWRGKRSCSVPGSFLTPSTHLVTAFADAMLMTPSYTNISCRFTRGAQHEFSRRNALK